MKKSYIVLALIILLAVVSTQYSNEEPVVTAVNSHVADIIEAPAAESADDSDDSDHGWGNPNTLRDHFERHGSDFNAEDAQDYARQAHEFYKNRSRYQVKTQDGVARVYDPETNTFGAYNSNGTTRTFYKPSDGQEYFDRQPGS